MEKTQEVNFDTPKNKDISKYYVGFANSTSLEQIHKDLFASLPHTFVDTEEVYYSKERLFFVMKEYFNTKDVCETTTFGDFIISFRQIPQQNGLFDTKIELEINQSLSDNYEKYLLWFYSLIDELDKNYADCFKSAYISYNYPEYKIVHKKVYRDYDAQAVENFILGAEWFVYANNQIFSKKLLSNEDITVSEKQNGYCYKANCDIFDFDGNMRIKITKHMQDLIIPAYSIRGWQELASQNWTVLYPPKRIDVYYDSCDNNDIILSYNYDIQKIEQTKGLKSSRCIGSFMKNV